MRPFTIYHSVTRKFSDYQEELVTLVREKAKVDRIFLLGASLYRRSSESIFLDNAPTSQHYADYFILVLIPDAERYSCNDLQGIIEQRCGMLLPVTAIVIKTTVFRKWLKEGHPFAVKVQKDAVEWYVEAGVDPFPLIDDNNEHFDPASRSLYYKEGLGRTKAFLAGAELFRQRGENTMAAFMLHQTVEQALSVMLETATGFHNYTHNIDRMIRNASLVCYQLPDVFPRNNELEKRIFTLLQKAYIETRYKMDYTIGEADLLVLTERVKYIMELLEETAGRYLVA
jgi:HEPN domain-containing protein